ncbi:MAG TPA: MoaD/ThiS family protein [Candidatus Nanoarchaeia archaeon]|nr:MoaD/ThiS family protein [Candidatus Nanoarchaeia archaeon]
MTVQLKFLGALRHASGKDQVSLSCQDGTSVFELIKNASRRKPALRRNLLDEQMDPPKPNALVLVNGREISILDGLETKVKDGDEIVFVPVVHGG